MNAKDTLIKARELLQVPGAWETGVLVMADCMCLLGAVAIAEGFIPSAVSYEYDRDTVYRQLEDSPAVIALAANIPYNYHRRTKVVYHFNDHPTRTLDEVLELLDKTIATVV